MSNIEDQKTLNLKHLNDPQPGDYWHDMFTGYLFVISVLENGNIVIADIKQTKDGQELDINDAYEITKEQLSNRVQYSNMQAFSADVSVAGPSGWRLDQVDKFHAKGSKYLTIEQQLKQATSIQTTNELEYTTAVENLKAICKKQNLPFPQIKL